MPSYQDPGHDPSVPASKSGSGRRATIRHLGSPSIRFDNPDDGEMFETGDASDFAGESLHKYSFENKNNLDNDRYNRKSAKISRRRS